MRNRLQELERRLLLDEEEDETSNSGSALTGAEWRGQAVQQIIFPPPPPGLAAAKKLLPSPTNSASSTVSSSASSSPPPPSFTPPPPSSSSSSSRHVLLDAAASIADGNLEAAEANLAVLKRSANPRGDAEQRLTAMMFATLLARLNPPRTGRSKAIAELCSGEHLAATQMLYDLSPCFKLSLIAANFAILEAVKDQPKIHIVDLDVGQGRQYDALIHALADRHRCRPSSARPPADPTTLLYGNYDSSSLSEVGGRIAKLAERAWGSVSPSSPGGRLSWTRRRLGTSPARPWLLTWRSSSRVWRTRAYRRRTPATSFSGVCALSARLW
ncbi:Scarecrow-like protein 8 [Musa troglodytarum]|uniref:Scarecrow-like protein 8 n=1 Tax=Musa troglodytarum TaxID=320322 RepID=A0A9E7EUX3_9LILI|nr:Scarecrow-like protein 8 [Musa troglodytarum]